MHKIKEILTASKAAPIWVWLLVFGAGSMVGGSDSGSAQVKTVQADLTEWKQLKELDDQIIGLSGEGFLSASEAMGYLATGDFESALDESNKLNGMTGRMRELSTARQALTKKLGY